MKLIKYDDRGKVVSSESTHIPEIEGKQAPANIPELNLVEPMTRRKTIRGMIVGLLVGLPLGVLVEAGRLLAGQPWDGPFWGIIVCVATLVLSTIIGYIQGTMADRE
jgi:hypothetical protein